MDYTDFLTIDFVLSFPGMMAICWLVVQGFSNFFEPKIMTPIRTRWVVLAVATLLVLLKTAMAWTGYTGILPLMIMIAMWLINSLAVWLATLKAHEIFYERG